jgi:hypothetical protein
LLLERRTSKTIRTAVSHAPKEVWHACVLLLLYRHISYEQLLLCQCLLGVLYPQSSKKTCTLYLACVQSMQRHMWWWSAARTLRAWACSAEVSLLQASCPLACCLALQPSALQMHWHLPAT